MKDDKFVALMKRLAAIGLAIGGCFMLIQITYDVFKVMARDRELRTIRIDTLKDTGVDVLKKGKK